MLVSLAFSRKVAGLFSGSTMWLFQQLPLLWHFSFSYPQNHTSVTATTVRSAVTRCRLCISVQTGGCLSYSLPSYVKKHFRAELFLPRRSSAVLLKRSLSCCAPSHPSLTLKELGPRIPVAFLGWCQTWSSWMWMTGNSRKNRDYIWFWRSFLDAVIYCSCS